MADYGIDMQSGRVWWLYNARRVATQANAAGGAVKVDITLAGGQTAQLVRARAANSGNNGISGLINDEDAALESILGSIGAGAGTAMCLPAIGTAASASNQANSVGMRFGPGETLAFEQTGAGVQNDTFTISVTLLLSTSTEPTWSKARSTNQADVTLAASTISTANTLQAVVL